MLKELDPFASSPEKDMPSPAIRSRAKHQLQIYDIECHHTTGGFDVRVVDIAAMESDFCDRGVQCVQCTGLSSVILSHSAVLLRDAAPTLGAYPTRRRPLPRLTSFPEPAGWGGYQIRDEG